MENIKFLPIDNMHFDYVVSALSETQDWGQTYVGIPEAHKHTKGYGIKIAVLDTGRPDHIDLNGNLLESYDCSGTRDVSDRQGHSSHLCGILAALENGIGIIGVAPEAKIFPIKVLSDSGIGGFENIQMGIEKAIELKADIINLSLGAPMEPTQSFKDTIKKAYNAGIIIVAAAGNDGRGVNYPALLDEVIAVGAIDQNGNLANFSSRGGKIAVVAPGVSIYSTYLNNQYAVLNGTSQASPLIAGICALILSWTRMNPTIPQIHNAQDMLKVIDELCDSQGRIGCNDKNCTVGFGIPKFANYMPWKENNNVV